MTFTVIRSDDLEWETAPYVILKGDEVFLDGIQEQSEAQSICDLLNQPPPSKLFPSNLSPVGLLAVVVVVDRPVRF